MLKKRKHTHPFHRLKRGEKNKHKKFMIIDETNQRIKKILLFSGIFLVIVVVLGGAIIIFQKLKPEPVQAPPVVVPQAPAEKQKDMIDSLEKANEQTKAAPEEQEKSQQDMLNALNEANKDSKPAETNQPTKQQKDMLDALNAANNK